MTKNTTEALIEAARKANRARRPNVDALKLMVVNTALKDMLKKGRFSICTVDEINAITGNIPNGEAYTLLRALHCISFSDMPQELQRGLPLLIQRAIGGESLEFDYKIYGVTLRVAA